METVRNPLPPLNAVGFWRLDNGIFSQCPEPPSLVREGWHSADLKLIVDYLKSGHDASRTVGPNGEVLSTRYCGFSTCRFRCNEGRVNGTLDFTDGIWLWPEGLAHYIERHSVILPEEFVGTMRSNDWKVPPEKLSSMRRKRDYTFWLGWSQAI